MIEVHTLHDKSRRVVGIHSLGHIGYGDGTTDVVYAAVSALEFNFVNFVEGLTDAEFEVHFGEEDGSFDSKFLGECNRKAEPLLQSLLLGYQTVQEAYGNPYLMIKDQEV